MNKLAYPFTPAIRQIDDYHGTPVADPYRWLEDADSPETQAWIEAQNALTFGFLAQVPARDKIRRRLTEIWDYARAWAPVKRGGRYFQLRNAGLQNQDVLYVMNSLDGEAQVLVDPNMLSSDGTISLTDWAPSPDGRWLAYATSDSGSDWLTWRVRDVTTGQDLPDIIEWSKFSGAAWRNDGSGFYYARYDAPPPGTDYTGVNYCQKLHFHRLGQPQAQDTLIYERPDQKEWGFDAKVSDDGRYLVLQVWQGTDVFNRLFYQDLGSGGSVAELISELEAAYQFVGNDGPVFYIRTNLDAPRSRLIAIDTARPEKAHWNTLLPESSDTLENVTMVHDEFIALYLHDAYHQLRRFDREGRLLGDITLPAFGSVPLNGNFLNLTGERAHDELFYGFWSFLYPVTIYRYDFRRGKSECIFVPPLNFDTASYITRQVFATSKDGTRVPLFLTHRRDLNLNGQNPTLLYGYGGFTIALVPTFTIGRLVWLENGGVLAWAIPTAACSWGPV